MGLLGLGLRRGRRATMTLTAVCRDGERSPFGCCGYEEKKKKVVVDEEEEAEGWNECKRGREIVCFCHYDRDRDAYITAPKVSPLSTSTSIMTTQRSSTLPHVPSFHSLPRRMTRS